MASVKRWKLVALLGTAGVLAPRLALSCSVCFVAGKENLDAYFGTAILLSLLPFALIGGLGFWLYRQHKARPESFSP
jgi:lipopolysaccharide export LptBFGC system permease protein LptF